MICSIAFDLTKSATLIAVTALIVTVFELGVIAGQKVLYIFFISDRNKLCAVLITSNFMIIVVKTVVTVVI